MINHSSPGFSEMRFIFKELEFSNEERIVDITGGWEYTLFVSSLGRIFFCEAGKSEIPFKIKKERAFEEVFLLPQLENKKSRI